MKTQITPNATYFIKEFKANIVPGIFKISFLKAMKDPQTKVNVGIVFVKYTNDLESRGFINAKVAQDMELKFVAILMKNK